MFTKDVDGPPVDGDATQSPKSSRRRSNALDAAADSGCVGAMFPSAQVVVEKSGRFLRIAKRTPPCSDCSPADGGVGCCGRHEEGGDVETVRSLKVAPNALSVWLTISHRTTLCDSELHSIHTVAIS